MAKRMMAGGCSVNLFCQGYTTIGVPHGVARFRVLPQEDGSILVKTEITDEQGNQTRLETTRISAYDLIINAGERRQGEPA